MEKILTAGRPEMIREHVPGDDIVPERGPFTICAITYLIRPQNLPPFYNAALSFTRAGIQVHAFGTVGRVGVKRHEEIAPGFTFGRITLRSRVIFHHIPGRLGDNVFTAVLQYLFSYVEYNVKTFLRARHCPADIVEAHDLPSLFCARLLAWHKRCPVVYHAHELWSEMGPHIRFRSFWRWLEKRLIRGIDLIVTPEENRARIYRDEYGAPEIPLVIANCPPFKPVSRGTILRELTAAKEIKSSCIVLYQGLITRERCIDEIVAATEFVGDNIALAIVGHGIDEWSDPPSRIPPGRRIVHLPHVAYEKLSDYTASADIGLLFYRNTCRNNYFCAPNKLYEYMMMGLPVITCNYPGLVAFVEGEEIGICVDPEDPRAIAGAINRISGDETLRSRMSGNCLRLAKERWNWEREFPRLYDAYSNLPAGLPVRTAGSRAADVSDH